MTPKQRLRLFEATALGRIEWKRLPDEDRLSFDGPIDRVELWVDDGGYDNVTVYFANGGFLRIREREQTGQFEYTTL